MNGASIDPAFVRRLRYVVGFPFPGVVERTAIWKSVFPEPSRVGSLDFERLARFPITGGSIFNAALAAAHAAAVRGEQITMPHVLDAIRWELRKMEKPAAEKDFTWVEKPAAPTARIAAAPPPVAAAGRGSR